MKQLRERQKLRLIDVAYKLGTTESTIRNWEHGRSIPKLTFEQMVALTQLYDCSVVELSQAYKETVSQEAS